MIGILYLLLCFLTGWVICTYFFPNLAGYTEKDYGGRKISLSPYLLLFPAWFVTGTLGLTWPVYIIAYLFGGREEPLFYANLIVLPIAFVLFIITFIIKYRKGEVTPGKLLSSGRSTIVTEIILLAAILALGLILMWTTFFIKEDKLYIGVSVFSDFSPHIGMIRSFSYGNNFPTTYSHFAGEDIKYHFMFQFLTGNLEYLGLRLDYAFNIPSIISFAGAFLMIYILAVKLTGKAGVGILSCLFFAFRSGKALYAYLTDLPEGTNIWEALRDNTGFVSNTPNEDWGLWNLNVYCNQRHLAFGLTVFFLVVILFLPNLYEMFESLKQYKLKQLEHPAEHSGEHPKPAHGRGRGDGAGHKLRMRITALFFRKDAWSVKKPGFSVAAGILLGALTFFHGSAAIGCLLVLFVMAVLSKHRLEYLITAVIALILSYLQSSVFIKESAFTVQYLFGFIAENKTLFGVASYLERLLGILPFVLIAAFCLEKGIGRYLMLAFTAPLLFAFTVSMTVDVTVNHKYIMMSCILLGIYAAGITIKLLEHRDILVGMVGFLLILCLTATGFYDLITVLKKNTEASAIVLDLDDPVTRWIDENSNSRDIFLTSNYSINQVVLAGAMLYEGWPYYPWSAGYDTFARTEKVKQMYEAESPEELNALVKENRIRFIIVDHDNRESMDYSLREENIRAAYERVYTQGEGEWELSIYDTNEPIYQ